MSIVVDSLLGAVSGITSGITAFFIVTVLSMIYKYFTNERLSFIIGILFGLGFLGISGGLLAILDQPSIGGVIEVAILSLFTIWGVTTGDKISDKLPRKSAAALIGITRGKPAYVKIKLPDAKLIYDMTGQPRVIDSLKEELALREFTLPKDLSQEEMIKRVRRRLITDWGIGDAELELDQDYKVTHLAIAAKTRGLSMTIPSDCLGIPIMCEVMPSNLSPGDIVTIYFENNESLERCELIGVDETRKVITVCANQSVLKRIRSIKASLVVVLPSASVLPSFTISVKQGAGEIEEFQFERMLSRLKRVGVTDELAIKIVNNVQAKIDKMEQPIPTKIIRNAVVTELKKKDPIIAKRYIRETENRKFFPF